MIIEGAYAPTEARPIEAKEEFYKNLSNRCQEIPRYREVIVIGDFNVRWHARRAHEEDILAPHIGGRGSDYLENEN